MNCLRMIPTKTAPVEFHIEDRMQDCGLMLLQRLYVLLFSDSGDLYRDEDAGGTLFSLMDGGNLPPAGILNSRLAIACAAAVRMLDDEDASQVESFTGTADDYGNMKLQLELTDGTVLIQEVKNV